MFPTALPAPLLRWSEASATDVDTRDEAAPTCTDRDLPADAWQQPTLPLWFDAQLW
jgi:hypothetical protein